MRYVAAIQGGVALIMAASVAAQAQVHAPGHGAKHLSGVQAPLVLAQAPQLNPNTMLVQRRIVGPETPMSALTGDPDEWFPGPGRWPGNNGVFDAFTHQHVGQLQRSGIETLGELISADPEVIGRIFGASPREAHRFQNVLRETVGASLPEADPG